MKLLEVVILHQWVGDLSQSFDIGFPPSQLVQDAVHCMKPHLNMFSVYPRLASLHLPGSTPGQNPNGRLTTPSQFAFGEARTWLCPPNKSSSQKTWLRSTRFSHPALCFVSALFRFSFWASPLTRFRSCEDPNLSEEPPTEEEKPFVRGGWFRGPKGPVTFVYRASAPRFARGFPPGESS